MIGWISVVVMAVPWEDALVACPVCGRKHTENRAVRRCPDCFHGWRPTPVRLVDYATVATDQPYDEDRACAQLAFMGTALKPGMSVFELGCGQGSLAVWLKTMVGPITYHGLEPSPHAAKAEQVMDRVWRDWAAFRREGGRYDLVIASHVLEHIADVDTVLSGFAGHLNPDGALFLEVPNGSGHPRLPRDPNPGHLHFFSAASLTRLLARHGFHTCNIASGAFESPRYPDSLRALAVPFSVPPVHGDELAFNLALEPGETLVVWGAGGTARELLDPFFPADLIHCFLDADPRRVGTHLKGRPVYAPDHLRRLQKVALLISSLDYEQEIRAQAVETYGDVLARIITLRDLLG